MIPKGCLVYPIARPSNPSISTKLWLYMYFKFIRRTSTYITRCSAIERERVRSNEWNFKSSLSIIKILVGKIELLISFES